MSADTLSLRERIAQALVPLDPEWKAVTVPEIIKAILPVVEQAIQQAWDEAQAWKDEALATLNRWHALGDALQPFASCQLGDNLPVVLTEQIPQRLAEKDAQIAALERLVKEPIEELHHAQCPWFAADTIRHRSVCGCPPGWPKITFALRETPAPPEPTAERSKSCQVCGRVLGSHNPNDTSTWRSDNFCSARCKKRAVLR